MCEKLLHRFLLVTRRDVSVRLSVINHFAFMLDAREKKNFSPESAEVLTELRDFSFLCFHWFLIPSEAVTTSRASSTFIITNQSTVSSHCSSRSSLDVCRFRKAPFGMINEVINTLWLIKQKTGGEIDIRQSDSANLLLHFDGSSSCSRWDESLFVELLWTNCVTLLETIWRVFRWLTRSFLGGHETRLITSFQLRRSRAFQSPPAARTSFPLVSASDNLNWVTRSLFSRKRITFASAYDSSMSMFNPQRDIKRGSVWWEWKESQGNKKAER